MNERPRRLARAGKIILLDLGGVLVEATGRTALRAFMPHLSEAQLLERWHGSNAVQLFERGKISPSAFAREFVEEWQLDIGEAEFVDHFASWVNGFYDGAGGRNQCISRQRFFGTHTPLARRGLVFELSCERSV